MKTLSFSMILVVILSYSCATVFSDLQSAKLVGKGNFETTPNFTTTSTTADGETDHIQNHFGFQLGYGLSNRIDLRARYEYIGVDKDIADVNTNVFGIGPKVSLLKDRIAAYVPIGFAFGGDVDGIDEVEIQPTLLFTFPVGEYVEINPSVKGIIGDEFFCAFNLGLGLSTNLNKYVIRPEYGIFLNPGESGRNAQFSVGATIYLFKPFSKTE
jgi:hypothetical protein